LLVATRITRASRINTGSSERNNILTDSIAQLNMKPRSLHTINDTPSQSHYIRNRDELETAKIRFSDNITNGISVLVQGHGYSRERAADLILDQIRQSDELPTDEEVSLSRWPWC
jgi:hypothetical protein